MERPRCNCDAAAEILLVTDVAAVVQITVMCKYGIDVLVGVLLLVAVLYWSCSKTKTKQEKNDNERMKEVWGRSSDARLNIGP